MKGSQCEFLHVLVEDKIPLCKFIDLDKCDGQSCVYRHYRLPHEEWRSLNAASARSTNAPHPAQIVTSDTAPENCHLPAAVDSVLVPAPARAPAPMPTSGPSIACGENGKVRYRFPDGAESTALGKDLWLLPMS
jgi:hypothetical protein